MKNYFNSYALSTLAVVGLGLGIAGDVFADTVDFTDNGSFITSDFLEANVTVSGSDLAIVIDGAGPGINGGLSSPLLDTGETMSFDFTDPVTDVVIDGFGIIDTTGDLPLYVGADLEGFDENGFSIGVVSIGLDYKLATTN
jgi:hypothetical protein